MRAARAIAAVAAAFACASASNQAGPAEEPSRAAPPTAAPAPPSTAFPAAPMTAAEAAEKAHEAWVRSRAGGSGGDARRLP